MIERFIIYCTFDDVVGTRAMIRAGGGTVVSTRSTPVMGNEGQMVAGFSVGYDLPMLESSTGAADTDAV